jgi:hypothetical protein
MGSDRNTHRIASHGMATTYGHSGTATAVGLQRPYPSPYIVYCNYVYILQLRIYILQLRIYIATTYGHRGSGPVGLQRPYPSPGAILRGRGTPNPTDGATTGGRPCFRRPSVCLPCASAARPPSLPGVERRLLFVSSPSPLGLARWARRCQRRLRRSMSSHAPHLRWRSLRLATRTTPPTSEVSSWFAAAPVQ